MPFIPTNAIATARVQQNATKSIQCRAEGVEDKYVQGVRGRVSAHHKHGARDLYNTNAQSARPADRGRRTVPADVLGQDYNVIGCDDNTAGLFNFVQVLFTYMVQLLILDNLAQNY